MFSLSNYSRGVAKAEIDLIWFDLLCIKNGFKEEIIDWIQVD